MAFVCLGVLDSRFRGNDGWGGMTVRAAVAVTPAVSVMPDYGCAGGVPVMADYGCAGSVPVMADYG